MGRTHVTTIQQPDDRTCGPVSIKHALTILGKRKSLEHVIQLCRTNRNGTTVNNMVTAVNKLGFPVLLVEYATLRHIQSALKYPPNHPRAVLVSYLYDLDEKDEPHPDSGHWATVASYRNDKSRIVLLDSASAQKKSYEWGQFRNRWFDFDLKRKRLHKRGRKFQLVRRWKSQLMMVIARKADDLPKFTIETREIFLPNGISQTS